MRVTTIPNTICRAAGRDDVPILPDVGTLWSKGGHEILFGVRGPRTPEVSALLARCGGQARALSVKELSRQTDLVVLAVRWTDVPAVLREAGPLQGTTLIDCMTPIVREVMHPQLDWQVSTAEQLARWVPGANVVKCFDTTGVKVMERPVFGDERVTMFLCGDLPEAKQRATRLAEDLRFECLDAGPLSAASLLGTPGIQRRTGPRFRVQAVTPDVGAIHARHPHGVRGRLAAS
jgi:predicted dinucleotide-binding enzyme